MSLINLRDRTINAKIVYYGTALSGKTTSLKHVHRVIDPENVTELVSLNTEGDRTLFFDFLPIPLGTVNGFQVKLQAFTVPGQVKYAVTRRYVLRGADGVILVADSEPRAFEENVGAVAGLRDNLIANGLDADKIPLVLQYNKRDMPGAVDVEALRDALNHRGVPDVPTIATSGEGVFTAFSALVSGVLARLVEEYRFGEPEIVQQEVAERFAALERRYESLRDRAQPAPITGPIAEGRGLVADQLRDPNEVSQSVIEVSPLPDRNEEDLPDVEVLLEQAVESNMEAAKVLSELRETRRRLADRAAQLAALHETGLVISSELDPQRLLGRVLESALGSVGATHGGVLFVDSATGRMSERMVAGYAHDPLAGVSEASPDVMRRVLQGAPFALTRTHDPNILAASDIDPAPHAALVAPMRHQGEVLGALVIYDFHEPADPNADPQADTRLPFLGAVALQATVALVNARLYRRVESFNQDLEQKVAERTRELAQAYRELQELDALKDDFLASMSHELLTPLTSITSFAEILSSTSTEEGETAASERQEFARIVHDEAQRLTGRLQSVLDLTMLEADRVTLEEEPLDMRRLVLEAYGRARAEFKKQGIGFRVRAADDVPPARGDVRWVGRVLEELLANACKFGREQTDVVVTIRHENGMIRTSVRDHGSGVPAELQTSVFDKFKQLGDVLTEKPHGLGLGLPTARLVVERLGGQIWYADGEDGGGVFSFTLPLARAAQPA